MKLNLIATMRQMYPSWPLVGRHDKEEQRHVDRSRNISETRGMSGVRARLRQSRWATEVGAPGVAER